MMNVKMMQRWVKRYMMMDTEGTRRDDEDPVGGDMESFGLTHEDTQDRDQ